MLILFVILIFSTATLSSAKPNPGGENVEVNSRAKRDADPWPRNERDVFNFNDEAPLLIRKIRELPVQIEEAVRARRVTRGSKGSSKNKVDIKSKSSRSRPKGRAIHTEKGPEKEKIKKIVSSLQDEETRTVYNDHETTIDNYSETQVEAEKTKYVSCSKKSELEVLRTEATKKTSKYEKIVKEITETTTRIEQIEIELAGFKKDLAKLQGESAVAQQESTKITSELSSTETESSLLETEVNSILSRSATESSSKSWETHLCTTETWPIVKLIKKAIETRKLAPEDPCKLGKGIKISSSKSSSTSCSSSSTSEIKTSSKKG